MTFSLFGDESRDHPVEPFLVNEMAPLWSGRMEESASSRVDHQLADADSIPFSKEVVLAGRTVPANDPAVFDDLVSARREDVVGARR